MGRYVTWEDIVIRYPTINNIGGASEIGSAYIGYTENLVDGCFATKFTVPFSSNNETVKDLVVELVYCRAGNLKVEESESKKKDIMDRIQRIKEGEESMILSDGTVLSTVGETVYSSSAAYNPIFDLGDVIDQEVDPQLIEDIDNAK